MCSRCSCVCFAVLLVLLTIYFIVVLVVVPAVFYNIPSFRHKLVFMNLDSAPTNFSDPSSLNITARNEYLELSNFNITLGLWLIPALNAERMFEEKRKTIIFCHGNAGNRASPIRLEKYKALIALNFDIVSFDYRGYGDSSGTPSSAGLVDDAIAVYEKVRQSISADRIILWGHSLGSGVAAQAVARLKEPIAGLVLETPFDNLGNVLKYISATYMLRILPCFNEVYVDTINNDPITKFDSVAALRKVNPQVSVTILAAQDDVVINWELAENLYENLQIFRNGSSENIGFWLFDGDLGYGHMYIHRSPDFAKIIKQQFA